MFDIVRPGLHMTIGSVHVISVLNMYWTKLILGLLVEKIKKPSATYDCGYETYEKSKDKKERENAKFSQDKENENAIAGSSEKLKAKST
jgi:hypothetical protein